LARFRNLYPSELSGGMRMRTAIARALVSDSVILFLDQPFDALDAITRKTLEIDMLRLWKQSQKTIVLITNSIEEAILLGKRVLVISPDSGSIGYETDVTISLEDRVETLCGNLKNTIMLENYKQNIRDALNAGRKKHTLNPGGSDYLDKSKTA
jgi:NitT/TauT family transport system ATP-binding protein